MEKLILNKENYYQIIKYCQEKKPAEACGIIAGEISEEKAEEKGVYYMKNIENSAEEYLMDPEEQFEVFRNIREKGWDLLSIFHSHPETPARPSTQDIEMAHYPEAVYTIISLAGSEPVMKAFKIEDNRYQEVEISIN